MDKKSRVITIILIGLLLLIPISMENIYADEDVLIINTVAGNGTQDFSGDGGPATEATMYQPKAIAFDATGNMYIADHRNHRIRKVDLNGNISTIAGNGTDGFSGDGGPAINAMLDEPQGVAVDSLGNVYIADAGNDRIRKVDLDGNITTIAGNGTADYTGDGGLAIAATLNDPLGILVDSQDNILIVDRANSAIRKIDATGIINTVVGDGSGDYSFSGDGGPATNATLFWPWDIALDNDGNLYIADTYNYRIRKVGTDGIINTIGGTGSNVYTADGSLATESNMPDTRGIAVDLLGNIYLSESRNHLLRKIGTDGILSTVAGTMYAADDYAGDGGPAEDATIYYSYGIVVDSSYSIFIVDNGNHAIRKITNTSKDASLSSLETNTGTYGQTFASASTEYTVSVSNTVSSITVTPTVNVAGATVKVNGDAVVTGTSSNVISLAIGENTITVECKSKDTSIDKTYTLVVTREKSSDATLSLVELNNATLTETFDSNVTSYTAVLADGYNKFKITPTANEPSATIKIDATTVTSGSISNEIAINIGDNTINVEVTAPDTTTVKTYAIEVTRAAFADADLSLLELSDGTLSPSFTSSQISYTAIVGYDISSIKITPTLSDENASVKVNAVSVTNGSSSGAISLIVGDNSIEIEVTAENTSTIKTYTIYVTREDDATLSSLEISEGILTPTFDAIVTEYTATVAHDISSIIVTPTVNNSNATVKVNGNTVTSGAIGSAIALSAVTTIDVEVTANNNVTTENYIVVITKESAPSSSSSSNGSNNKKSSEFSLVVNSETEINGTEKVENINGEKTVLVELNNDIVSEKIDDILDAIEESGSNEMVLSTDTQNADSLKTLLTGDVVKRMGDRKFDLSIEVDNIEYIIPAEQIGIESVAGILSVDSDSLKSIEVEILIEKLDNAKVEEIKKRAELNDYEILVTPVEFNVVAKTETSSGEETEVTISKFSDYVVRCFDIPSNVDPTKITTGVVYKDDGTFLHLPTVIFRRDGQWCAKINSLTNSSYSVISNEIIVEEASGHWAEASINDMASRAIINEYENFTPDENITRGEFVEYITNAIGIYRTDVVFESRFTDVEFTDKYFDAITIAAEYGIIEGYTDGSFKAGEIMTREEAMTINARAMKIVKLAGSDTAVMNNYVDYEDASDWAKELIKDAVSAKVFNGTSETTLSPNAKITYAEAAQSIKNLLVGASLINE